MTVETRKEHTWLSKKVMRDLFNKVFRWYYRHVSFHLLQGPGKAAETKQQHSWLSKKGLQIFSYYYKDIILHQLLLRGILAVVKNSKTFYASVALVLVF